MPFDRKLRRLSTLFLVLLLLFLSYQYRDLWRLRDSVIAIQANEPRTSNYAFVTFLGGNTQSQSPDFEDDPYFMSIRQMAYKLLHANPIQPAPFPLLVLCTEEVSSSKRDRLRKDGTIVIPVESVSFTMPQGEMESRWRDVFTKLRMFELTDYSKICYLDADLFVIEELNDIFEDPATLMQHTLDVPANIEPDEPPLPDSYMIAGLNDWTIPSYLNAGLLVLAPSQILFEHYLSVSHKPERFNRPYFLEQGLLNYVHSPERNMPYKELSPIWGKKIAHDKFWLCETTGCPSDDYVMGAKWKTQREEMKTYWGEGGMKQR